MITIYGDGTRRGTRRLHHAITLSGIKCSVEIVYIIRSIIDEIPPTTLNRMSIQ